MKKIAAMFVLALALAGCRKPDHETREGMHICVICGRVEEYKYVDGKLEYVRMHAPRDFTKWFVSHGNLPHRCDRCALGCTQFHQKGGSTIIEGSDRDHDVILFHDIALKIPESVALRLVRGLIAASKSEREAALPPIPMYQPTADFYKLAEGSVAQFDDQWKAFLDKYPAWHRIWELGAP